MSTGRIILIVGYTIGVIGFLSGLVILYESSSGRSTAPQIPYYPLIGTVLLIVGAVVCYGGYRAGRPKLKVD